MSKLRAEIESIECVYLGDRCNSGRCLRHRLIAAYAADNATPAWPAWLDAPDSAYGWYWARHKSGGDRRELALVRDGIATTITEDNEARSMPLTSLSHCQWQRVAPPREG